MVVQPGLCLFWFETLKTGFSRDGAHICLNWEKRYFLTFESISEIRVGLIAGRSLLVYLLLIQFTFDNSLTIQVTSLKRESGRFSFHFREGFQKCIEYTCLLIL